MSRFQQGGFQSIPPVIKNLLIVNVRVLISPIIFINQGFPLEEYGALQCFGSGNFKAWQLITYMFMHSAVDGTGIVFSHILFNMFTLWMFGSILENVWGGKRFLTFYMICGVIAGVAQLFLQKDFGLCSWCVRRNHGNNGCLCLSVPQHRNVYHVHSDPYQSKICDTGFYDAGSIWGFCSAVRR